MRRFQRVHTTYIFSDKIRNIPKYISLNICFLELSEEFPRTRKQHYENTPIQTYRKFYLQKVKLFRKIISDIFHISAQNIDCGYSLEPPRRGGSNEYPQSMFLSRNKKNNVYPCKPQFYYIKWGWRVENYIGMFSWWIRINRAYQAIGVRILLYLL